MIARDHGEPERLLRIASDIADLTPVDWDNEAAREPVLAHRLSGLQNLERLAAAHARLAQTTTAPADLGGFLLSHYRIVDRIGSGGMGTVYRARDERLGRIVALKVVHEARVADETARQMLMREARIASGIKHPNVAPIFDVGESQERVFIAMEYVEGKTLAERILERPLTVREALPCAIQIASALQAVHDAGVVHRDLKCGNITLTRDGWVKVLDFGIAVRSPGEHPFETSSQDSKYGPAGRFAGTPAYMAPELLRGNPPDKRSDIWALGVTLYEAVTARHPFLAGRLAPARLPELERAIASQDPADLPASIPMPLRRVIERCMERNPDQRYQHASEVRAALEAIRDSTPTARDRGRRFAWALAAAAGLVVALALILPALHPAPRQRSLLVLPTRNVSGLEEQQFLAAGLTDDLINTFAKLSSIRVSGRTTSDAIADEHKPLHDLARKHSLDVVLESSVVRVGDQVRVNVQLMDARSDRQIWAQSYGRPVQEVLTLDGEIARGVARCLKLRLTGAELTRLEPAPRIELSAYQAYVLGRNLAADRSYRRALSYYIKATRLDSTFAPAQAGLANCYTEMLYYGDIPPEEALHLAVSAASRALSIDSTQALAHLALARVHGIQMDWANADAQLERALQDEPGNPEVWYNRSLSFGVHGRVRDGVDAMEHAVSLDPLSTRYANELGLAYLNARRVNDAAGQFLRVYREGEGDEARLAHAYWARCLVLQGKAARGVAALRATAGQPATTYEEEELAYALARSGRRADALRTLDRLREAAERGIASPLAIAAAQLAAGERERAFATLFRASDHGDPRLVWLGVDARFDPIRNDRRFRVLMQRMNLSVS